VQLKLGIARFTNLWIEIPAEKLTVGLVYLLTIKALFSKSLDMEVDVSVP
jgi:hypothetical protein